MEMSDPELLQRLLEDPPPARVSAFLAGSEAKLRPEAGLKPLADYVEAIEPAVSAVVAAWLAPYYAVEGVPRLLTRMGLSAQVVLINREGHQFSRFGVSFHAPDPADTGILARQREIEALEAEARKHEDSIEERRAELSGLDRSLVEHDEGLAKLRAAGAALKQRHHERQLENLKLTQGQERYQERSRQLDGELSEIKAQQAQERAGQTAAETGLERRQSEIDALYRKLESTREEEAAAERKLETQRQAVLLAEREVQEAGYAEKECISKINEKERSSKVLLEHAQNAERSLEQLQAELAGLDDEALRTQLHRGLATRIAREQTLAGARRRQEEIANRLRSSEETRLAREQKLQPLRDRIAELRLKEQAARIASEQFAQQLREAGAAEAALAGVLKEGPGAASLQGAITRLTKLTAKRGATNIAGRGAPRAHQARQPASRPPGGH